MNIPTENAALVRQFNAETFNRGNVEFPDSVHGLGYPYLGTRVLEGQRGRSPSEFLTNRGSATLRVLRNRLFS
jgi:hypothetical protein